MKTLMKLFSILFFIIICYCTYQLIIVSTSIYSIIGAAVIGGGSTTTSEVINTNISTEVKIFSFIFSNILSFIILAVGSSMLLKDDTNKFLRIIPFVVVIGIIMSMILSVFDINTQEGLGKVMSDIINVLKACEIFFLPIVCLGNLSANNSISEITKKIGYIILFLCLGLLIYLWIKKNALDVLPDPYAENSLAKLGDFGSAVKFFSISIMLEFACLILSYTTNYAFEVTTLNADNVNYEELKKQAEFSTQMKINSIYNKEKEEKIDRSISEKTGLMNINNQLGANSNVGTVSDEMKNKTGLVETAFIMSKGPVVNQNLVQNNNEVTQNSNTLNSETNNSASSNDDKENNSKFGIENNINNDNINQNNPVINPSLVGFNQNNNNNNSSNIQS